MQQKLEPLVEVTGHYSNRQLEQIARIAHNLFTWAFENPIDWDPKEESGLEQD